MQLSRRDFLALSGVSSLLGVPAASGQEPVTPAKLRHAKETTSICPYCGVGCGLIVHTVEGKIVNIEGDPDSPLNEGAVCSKGASVFQLHQNERRLRKVRHRRAGSSEWEDMSWDDAVSRIAGLVKNTRDATWTAKDGDVTVNRAEGIACLGGAALDTEECYLLSKSMRALGLVWLEHQARI